MELGLYGFYQHVIYIYLHRCSDFLLEHLVHQPLVGGSCVLQSEEHHSITLGSLPSDEWGLLLVVGVHTDMIVAREGVYEAEEFMTGRGVHYEVDPR